jgi:hypothetical protein
MLKRRKTKTPATLTLVTVEVTNLMRDDDDDGEEEEEDECGKCTPIGFTYFATLRPSKAKSIYIE